MAAEFWLPIYHRLPPVLLDTLATIRGWHLQRLRYGPETGLLVEETLQRDHWTPEQWESWQQEKLARLLHRAATKVPYYRRLWAERRARGDQSSWERLENWPILEKEVVRQNPEAFLADDCNPRQMYATHTSGTSGTPLRLWQSRKTLRAWYALCEARWRRWHGVDLADRWAILGGQLVVPVWRKKPPYWVHNRAMHQLYLSSYHLSPDSVPSYADALRRFQPAYLYGYSSALFTLAYECVRQGLGGLQWKVILTNAEPLFEHQRLLIQEAFRTPVRETYGMSEMAAAAGECEHGRMHWFPDAGVVEIAQPDRDGAGDLIATGLINEDMPLIRYRVGDRVKPSVSGESCPCGRKLPLLERIEGRLDDVILTPDGRQIGRLDPVFKADLPIREAQIVQESLHLVRVRIVPAGQFGGREKDMLKERLLLRLGKEMKVEVEIVNEIERTRNGKFRAVISKVAAQSRPV